MVDGVREKVRSDELETYVTGAPAVYQDLEAASNEDVKQAEKYAFPFAVVILIFAFGTLVAAGVPVLIGGASVLDLARDPLLHSRRLRHVRLRADALDDARPRAGHRLRAVLR